MITISAIKRCSADWRLAGLLFLLSCPTHASQLKVYQYTQSNGVVAFSDKAPQQQPYKVLRYDCFACGVSSQVNFRTTPLFLQRYRAEISHAARVHQLEPSLIQALIHAESGFNPQARSKVGAQGLMQLMPETAKDLGVTDVWTPKHNINAGTAYLAALLQQFQGDQQLALAAYNAGPSTVDRYNGVPPFAETKAYLQRVQILQQRYQRAGQPDANRSAL